MGSFYNSPNGQFQLSTQQINNFKGVFGPKTPN